MKHEHSQKGFSAVKVLIAFLIVIVIVVAGGLVWHRHNLNAKPKVSSSQSQTATTKNLKGVLYIKEWSVTLDYDNTEVTLQYAVNGHNANEATVSSTQLAAAVPACSLSSADSTGVGDIVHGKPADAYSASKTYQQYLNIHQSDGLAGSLAGYVYVYQVPQQTCSGSTANTLQEQTEAAVKSIFQ